MSLRKTAAWLISCRRRVFDCVLWERAQVPPPVSRPVLARKFPCVESAGIVVDAVRGLVVVTDDINYQFYVYSLADGALVRSFGGQGSGKGQYNWYVGVRCLTPAGTVLMADYFNKCVQEVNIDDGSHVRRWGEAVLSSPSGVDCNDSVVAVTDLEEGRVTLLSWPDGSLLRQFGSVGSGDGQLYRPYAVRLLFDGSGVVVADQSNNRLCIFSMAGAFLRSIAYDMPYDVLECDGGASFIVTSWENNTVSKVSVATGAVVPFGSSGSGGEQWDQPAALAVVGPVGDHGSSHELVVLEIGTQLVQVFRV